ncbi:hypothetical protein STCU_08825 [Strigomonas culicis]|uniref:VIT domain-containing protein n=1 Tax=Strigomonas culicis TaxID=28005 RepID=S9VCJ4_9TRYP|nr:hypothetical protein STCU_08825 [Strigomonas culicis]|eukprot:EPY20805.1 hypothetical protein STCU_08825 [Strigomonas culicis]
MSCVAAAFSSFPSKDRGLLTADSYTPLSLLGERVTVALQSAAARVTVELEYLNESGKDAPVIVALPVPSGWILQGGEVSYDGKQAATSFVQNAVHTSVADATSGAAAAVSDSTVWTVATLPVPWGILVGTAAHVTAHYIVPRDAVATLCGQQRFVLPAALFLRPAPSPAAARAYTDRFSLPVKRQLKDGVDVLVRARLDVPLRGAARLLVGDADAAVPAAVQHEGDAAFQLQYAAPFAQHPALQRATVVCDVQDTEEPLRLFLEADSGHAQPEQGHALCVGLTPALGRCAVNAELVLLVDVHSVDVARAVAGALESVLRGVPAATLVNVVLLRDEGSLCVYPGGSQPMAQVDVAAVCGLLAGLPPQRPGTGVSRTRAALQAVLAQTDACGPTAAGHVRNVLLLADESEDPSAAAALVALGAQHRHAARVHAVGLEYVPAVDAATLEVLAQEGGGVYAAAASPDDLAAAVVRVLLAATVPTLTEIKVQFADTRVRPAFEPQRLQV